MPLDVSIRVLDHAKGLPLPGYATAGSAGCDLRAALSAPQILAPGEFFAVPTGLCIALPPDHEAQVRPRSGLAVKHGVTLLNGPGTIDADYRGEIRVALINLSQQPYEVCRGDRIAQLVIAPVVQCQWRAVEQLDETERGAGGFGSTGRA